MVFIYNLFEKIFNCKISEWNINEKKYVQNISVLFFTTLAAQIGTIPLTADYFGKVSVISLIANVIAVPLANLSLAIGFFQIITGIFSDYFSSIIAGTNNILLSFQLLFIKWCSSVKYCAKKHKCFGLLRNYNLCILFYINFYTNLRKSETILFQICNSYAYSLILCFN